ncbi:hypothetical protein AVEN_219772-1 [Araneus ventricosus]|uniref:Uncharacterized protein n=1 Tax=Araneus ventricosus TaxID=182803 RepID=A0A4Y2PFL2_ARAVE|nr:hypothetical protein AVEN_219772-1 [Araneus ventricosus]
MMKTTPELSLPSPNFRITPAGRKMRGTVSTGATNRNILLNECTAAPLVGGIEDRTALILVDDLRNAADV